MADYRVLDIETVPDFDAWAPPPVDPAKPDVFPAPHGHRIVAMSWVDLTAADGRWYCHMNHYTDCDWDHANLDEKEREIIKFFLDVQNEDAANMVTWNGRTFDLPVINMRALKHGLPWPSYYQERDVRYRYTEAGHCDVMDFFTDFGAAKAMKLGEISKLIGLPGKVGPISGSAVADEFEKSKTEPPVPIKMNISRYCLTDSIQTAILFIRSRFHRGSINAKEHNVAISSFAENTEINEAFETPVNWDKLMMSEGSRL